MITIALPAHTQAEDISLTFSDAEPLGEGYNIAPGSASVPLSYTGPMMYPEPNTNTYTSDALYPSHVWEQQESQRFRGYELLIFTVYPLQYRPSTGELWLYSQVTLTITLRSITSSHNLYRDRATDSSAVQQVVDNPIEPLPPSPPAPLDDDSYSLLILTTETFKAAFQPLAQAHNNTGCITKIKTLSDVGSTDPTDIRSFITNEYTTNGIEYVLLGGDIDDIPAQELYLGKDGSQDAFSPSDLYYACLDGPFNYDGDNKWGEPTDGEDGGEVDLYAEVYVGRASVSTIEETQWFVEKTIQYIYQKPEYLSDVILVGHKLSGDQYGGDSLDELIDESHANEYTTQGLPSDEFSITKLYERDIIWDKYDLLALLNDSTYIVDHLGHGGEQSAMKIVNSDAEQLVNPLPFFVYSQACKSGYFDYDQGDCLAEAFTVKSAHGAFAVVMNTREGWFSTGSTDGPSHRYNRQYWDAIYGEDIDSFGQALADSKEDNIDRISEDKMRWCYYEIHLFGDPALEIYQPAPTPSVQITSITGGFGVHTNLENTGTASADDIQIEFSITGGAFGFVNKNFTETLQDLGVDDNESIATRPFLGLGLIHVTVSVTVDDNYPIKESKTLFILGLYSFKLPQGLEDFLQRD